MSDEMGKNWYVLQTFKHRQLVILGAFHPLFCCPDVIVGLKGKECCQPIKKAHEISNLGENALNDHNYYFPFSHQPIIDSHLFPFKPNRLFVRVIKLYFFFLF